MRPIDMSSIVINGEEYPVYCDLYVLQKLQDRMSLNDFERGIIGAEIMRDENGEPLYDDQKRIRLKFGKYNFETLAFGLALMINEGIDIKEEQGEDAPERVTEKQIMRTCDIGYIELSNIVHDAFNRCFEHKKKSNSTKTRQRKKIPT